MSWSKRQFENQMQLREQPLHSPRPRKDMLVTDFTTYDTVMLADIEWKPCLIHNDCRVYHIPQSPLFIHVHEIHRMQYA